MSKQILTINFKKKDGKFVIATNLMKDKYKLFLASLEDGAEIEALFELKELDNTRAQLAKIHVCIKEMADEQGSTVKEMKEQVKRECGMSFTEDDKLKYQSFARCSKEELSTVIETIIQMGEFLNINLVGTLS